MSRCLGRVQGMSRWSPVDCGACLSQPVVSRQLDVRCIPFLASRHGKYSSIQVFEYSNIRAFSRPGRESWRSFRLCWCYSTVPLSGSNHALPSLADCRCFAPFMPSFGSPGQVLVFETPAACKLVAEHVEEQREAILAARTVALVEMLRRTTMLSSTPAGVVL